MTPEELRVSLREGLDQFLGRKIAKEPIGNGRRSREIVYPSDVAAELTTRCRAFALDGLLPDQFKVRALLPTDNLCRPLLGPAPTLRVEFWSGGRELTSVEEMFDALQRTRKGGGE